MASILLEIQEDETLSVADGIVCSYFNSTNRPQIIRISDIRYSLERIVLPKQRLLFEAARDVLLEIHTSEMVTAILTDKISCADLYIESFKGKLQ